MKDSPAIVDASWNAVFLVCKDCQKRSKGPKKLKSKIAAHEIKLAARALKPRARVVTTGCLGLCPKAALAIGFVGRTARLAAVDSAAQVRSAVDLLMAPARAGGAPEPAARIPPGAAGGECES